MADGESYSELLKKWCITIKPKRILEWGTGQSTFLMREMCPDAEIITIEHKKKYFDISYEYLKNKDIIMMLIDEIEYVTPMSKYSHPPVKGKFDLIFVDGRQRVKCMENSVNLLKKNGVLILHDSERAYYKRGINLFQKIEESEGTICLQLQS